MGKTDLQAAREGSITQPSDRSVRVGRGVGIGFLAVTVAGLLVLAADRWMEASTRGQVYHQAEAAPARKVAIVFGAMVYPSGELSAVLRERVDAAVDLYRAGKVRKLLMTGDNGRPEYDEVTAMKRYAVEEGVPPEDVIRDYAGFRTYDSCYRARDIFGVRDAILVTQAFHLPRALYTAGGLGIDAVGLEAEPGMPPSTLRASRTREVLARAAAVIDVQVLRRKPRFLGPREPLFARNDPHR